MTMIWIDTETTGLDPETNYLLEVGCIITDDQLNEKARAAYLVKPEDPRYYKPTVDLDHVIETSGAWARKTHSENGLWDDLRSATMTPRDVEKAVVQLICDNDADGSILAGSSVHFDRRWLRRYMPELETHLHYRNFDVSVLDETFKRFSPDADGADTTRGRHRVLDDLEDSIAQLKYYLQALGWREA